MWKNEKKGGASAAAGSSSGAERQNAYADNEAY